MNNLNNIIGELSELNYLPGTCEADQITIDLHKGLIYIYSRFELWKGILFRLDDITKILHKYGCGFYMSDTKYNKPVISVSSY